MLKSRSVKRDLWFLPIMSGLMAGLAFPPGPFWLLGLFCLIPLYKRLDSGGGFFSGFLSGMLFYGMTIYWIGLNAEPPGPVAAASAFGAMLWLSFWFGAGTWLLSRILTRFGPLSILLHGPLMVSIDWLLESSEMGFPWPYLGVTQAENPLFTWLPAFGGMHAMTLALLVINGLFWLGLSRPESRRHLAFSGLALLLLIPGLGKLGSAGTNEQPDSLRVVVIQGNVDPIEKWEKPYSNTVDRHLELSRQALAEVGETDLLIWSETAVPTRLTQRPHLLRDLEGFCLEHNLKLLTGANHVGRVNERRKPFNGSFLLTPDGIADEYYKIRLVPFGERVPGQKLIPALGKVNLGQAEFAAGEDRSAGRLPMQGGDTLSFAWSICFEDNFSALARDMVRDGAAFLTNQTNDAWFGTSRELDQHLAVAALRTVETGRWLVRATNNGYSGFIDDRGRPVALLPKGESGWLSAKVPMRSGKTFYVWSGDLLPKLSILLASWPLLLLLVEYLRGRWKRKGSLNSV